MPKPRETCTQCSLRRQRCNRQIPCDRCIKRGVPDQCTRQWPDNQTPTRDLSAARRETSLLIEQHEDVPLRATERLQNQVDHRLVLPDDDRSSALDIISTGNGAERFFDGLNVDAHTFEPRGQSVSAPEAPSFATSIDTQREQVVLRPTVPQAPSEKQTAELELQLPSIEQIWHLVDYHETSLLWYHGCYHGPTFRHELEEALEKGNGILDIENLNLQWMALLFSVMAGSLACCPDRILSTWGFWKTEVFELSLQWYKATVTCLNLSGYMSNHQLLSVHAITTLSMAAHTLGLSEDLSVLLSTALRIARSLRIDHIKYDPALDDIDAQATELRRRKVLRREIARRLWSQLCVQDWFAIPFHGSQCISAIDFTTSKPSNRNHITMEPLPRTFPTYISYGNYLYDIASLVAEHHVAMAHSSTPFTKYQRVLEFDARMKRLARDEMPVYFQVTAPIDASWPEFVPWARRSLTVCFAHKMLMIHRAFIRRSFTNPAFQITKATCIAAARTILNEAKKEREDSAPIIWIDQAFCIAAGITLCLHILHTEQSDPEHQLHVKLVQDCIAMLQTFGSSIVASRGAHVLSALLGERERIVQPINSSRKRGHQQSDPSEDGHDRNKRRAVDIPGIIQPLVSGTNSEDLRGIQAQSATALSHQTTLLDMYDHEEEPDFTRKRYPELFPPQAGFSNSFLFDDLLKFDD